MTARAESNRPISELYALLAEFGLSTGCGNLKDSVGCWEHAIDKHWWCAANGHEEPTSCSRDCLVDPFHFVIFRDLSTWPTAIVGPYEGIVVCGHNMQAIEHELIAAVKAAIACRVLHADAGSQVTAASK